MSILENESDYYSSWPPLDIHWHQRTTVLVHTFQWITRIYTTPTSCFGVISTSLRCSYGSSGLRYIHLSHPSDIRFDLRFLLWICRKYSTKNGGLAKDHTFYWIFSAPFPIKSRMIKENNYIKPWPNSKHRPLDIWALLLTHHCIDIQERETKEPPPLCRGRYAEASMWAESHFLWELWESE